MVDQVLIVTFRDGTKRRSRRQNWADLADLREKYDQDPRVTDTSVEYDI